MVNKIKREKLVPKLVLAIFIITVLTGFACTFATAKESQSSIKLDFEAVEVMEIWDVQETRVKDGKLIMKAYKKANLVDGKIDNIEFTGYIEIDFTVIMDPITGEYISFGPVTMHVEWNGLSGSFFGFVIAKGIALVSGDGVFVLCGAGDFEGMMLFGKVWTIDAYWGINGLSGIILGRN